MNRQTVTGMAATLAIAAAAGSLVLTCMGHPVWGLVTAVMAQPLGILGILRSIHPRIRGFWLSIGSMLLGAVAAIVALLAVLGVALTGAS